MEAYQQRVVDEKRDLDEKIEKLSAFMKTAGFGSVQTDEQARLHGQLVVMVAYSELLKDRIAAFPPPAPKIIPPTIGRRVWYWPSDYDRGMLPSKPSSIMVASDSSQPCDAGIACVWSDRMVNLSVADHNGVIHSRCSVTLLQEGDAVPSGAAYAQWMPYQIGQAKK